MTSSSGHKNDPLLVKKVLNFLANVIITIVNKNLPHGTNSSKLAESVSGSFVSVKTT